MYLHEIFFYNERKDFPKGLKERGEKYAEGKDVIVIFDFFSLVLYPVGPCRTGGSAADA